MKIVLLVEGNDLWLVDGINNHKATTCLVATGVEPTFNEVKGFTTDPLPSKLATDTKTTYQYSRVST